MSTPSSEFAARKELDDWIQQVKTRNAARVQLMHLAATVAAGGMPEQQGQLINPEEIADDAISIAMAIIRKAWEHYPTPGTEKP